MLPLRLIGVLSCGQETDGREARVAPERTVLSMLRRDGLDMVDGQILPKKRLKREEKLFLRQRRPLGGRRCAGSLGEFNARDIFFRLQDYSGLIGFGRPAVADPDDAEASLGPEAAHFDGLARRG